MLCCKTQHECSNFKLFEIWVFTILSVRFINRAHVGSTVTAMIVEDDVRLPMKQGSHFVCPGMHKD